MSCFSQRDIEMQEYEDRWGSSKLESLQSRLDYLQDSLAIFERRLPLEAEDPMFDRLFYEDFTTDIYDDVCSIQGALAAKRKVEDLIDEELERVRGQLEEEKRLLELRTSIIETGVTPDDQIALVAVFVPEMQRRILAA